MAIKTINDTHLTGIANAIRNKYIESGVDIMDDNGEAPKYKPSEMATAIGNLPSVSVKPVIMPLNVTENGEYVPPSTIDGYSPVTVNVPTGGAGIPSEALTISGSCNYRFANGGWDWFIENYGDQITTNNINRFDNMFLNSKVANIPFEINFTGTVNKSLESMFNGCENLVEIPKINGVIPNNFFQIFNQCRNIRYLPDDIATWFDWSYLDGLTNSYTGQQNEMFRVCCSLRAIPIDFISHGNPNITYSYSYFKGFCASCYALDELINLPIPYTATWTSNAFSLAFDRCYRIKNITFAMPDGQPYVMNWKGQTIDLTRSGYPETEYTSDYIIQYNSGITIDKMVTDDATYQALKNDPDWFPKRVEYSRYNHDSAVATINSLPDTSAYLAANGGTNTIKFKGESGSATDGGAINTLTEEEIAVATAKGWTVTLV